MYDGDFLVYIALNKYDMKQLQSQLGTAKLNNMSRSFLYVFTEEGTAMLSSVLKTEKAAEVSVSIMRAFVKMKKYISNNLFNSNNYSKK